MNPPCLIALVLLLGGCAIGSADAVRSARPFILPANSPPLDTGEGGIRILADARSTGGGWSALERTEPPGTRTSLHRHDRMDEAFYVVSGEFTVFLDGRLHRLPAGSFVFIPRGTPHAQGNTSAATIKIVSMFSPSGWEQSARDRAALHAEHPVGTPGFAERIGAVFERYDIEVLGPSPIEPQ